MKIAGPSLSAQILPPLRQPPQDALRSVRAPARPAVSADPGPDVAGAVPAVLPALSPAPADAASNPAIAAYRNTARMMWRVRPTLDLSV